MERRKITVGGAVDECIRDATEEWFSEHAGWRSREESATADIKGINTVVEVKPGGQLSVSVTIVTYRAHKCSNNWYPYQRLGKFGYVREPHSKAVG